MKANEPMLGDWVYGLYPNGSRYANPFRISAVDIYPLNRSPRIVTMGGYGFQEEHFEPIPLTPEILEKNGWKEAQFWHEYQDGKNTIQSCLPDMRGIINGVEIQHFKCEYVHQYQHLLRLCGLDELADNFKV